MINDHMFPMTQNRTSDKEQSPAFHRSQLITTTSTMVDDNKTVSKYEDAEPASLQSRSYLSTVGIVDVRT